jgi:hypothetical protein
MPAFLEMGSYQLLSFVRADEDLPQAPTFN